MTAPSKFKEDHIYYQCDFSDAKSPIITSWVFVGFRNTPGKSCTDCDVPFHFYAFAEWNSWWSSKNFPNVKSRPYTLDIPSLRHAEMSMLTWDEVLQEIQESQCPET